jgi:hypothetical protein
MTELTPASPRQNGRFHETIIPDSEVRWLMDEWHDALQLVTAAVSDEFGIPTPLKQQQAFSAPYHYESNILDDPRALLGSLFNRLECEPPEDRSTVEADTANLLTATYIKNLRRMHEWWQQGYFPRVDSLVLDGHHYQIYNHQPAFAFTGKVLKTAQRDLRTGKIEWWLYAELDREPLRDDAGDFVPVQPELPVVVLPTLSYEPVATRQLVNAHLNALRNSLAPWVREAFAPNLQAVPEPVPQPSSLERMLARFALLMPKYLI